MPPRRYAINLTPSSLLDRAFEATALAAQVRAVGLDPRQITIECTEQQSVPDIVPLQRQVKALRRLGFGFAVDDAGAGYASFALIAALRPSVIKIDRDIVHGLDHDDAKQALVEAFVSFGRRIGAHLLAEGIERRADLAALTSLGVELGQGYLLGKPAADPAPPRRLDRAGSSARPRAHAKRCVWPCGAPLAYHRGHDRPLPRRHGPTAGTPLPDHIRAFLDDERYATISTIDPDGGPRQAVVWYTLDGDEFVINSRIGRRWPSNLLRDPRIALSVIDAADGARWAGLTGTVRPITGSARRPRPTSPGWRAATTPPTRTRSGRSIADFESQDRISFRFRADAVHDHLDDE